MFTHAQLGTFRCTSCCAVFRRQGDLEKHAQVHEISVCLPRFGQLPVPPFLPVTSSQPRSHLKCVQVAEGVQRSTANKFESSMSLQTANVCESLKSVHESSETKPVVNREDNRDSNEDDDHICVD